MLRIVFSPMRFVRLVLIYVFQASELLIGWFSFFLRTDFQYFEFNFDAQLLVGIFSFDYFLQNSSMYRSCFLRSADGFFSVNHSVG